MTDQLKACPFCGGSNLTIEAAPDEQTGALGGTMANAVFCANECGVGPIRRTAKEAMDAWNTRAQAEDVSFSTVEKVVKALSRIGHTFPESQEEQAARFESLVLDLCREVQSHFNRLSTHPPRAQGDEPTVRNDRMVEDDVRDFGTGITVDGKRVCPTRVVIHHKGSGYLDDARDAARYRLIREGGKGTYEHILIHAGSSLDRLVDLALSAQRGEAE